jgi:hypothetical protein
MVVENRKESLVRSRRSGVNKLAGCLAAGVFVLAVTIPGLAQGGNPGPPPGAGPPPNINPKLAERARQANEARLYSVEMEAGGEVENQKHIAEAIANMKQDFTRIQVVRNNIARNLVAHKPLDYSLITQQTTEINRRAHRLNVYMLARAPEDKEQNSTPDVKSEEMVDALVKLCKLIDSFTENPVLKNAATIDAKERLKVKEDKAKADGDLLAIIKLSERIEKVTNSLRSPK